MCKTGASFVGVSAVWLDPTSVTTALAGIQLSNLVAAATLPQCWSPGALLVLFYRVSAMLVPPQSWGREAQSNRRASLHLLCYTVALVALRVGALYMDSFTMGVD